MGTTFTGGGPHITIGAPATGGKAVTVAPTKAAAPKAAAPKAAAPKLPPRPPNPAIGGHYVRLGNKWQLIHAVGPGKWAQGPVPTVAPGVRADNPLLGNQPLTGAARYKAAQAIADAQTTEPISELTSQIAAQNRQTAGTMQTAGGYFNQLGQQAQQGVTDQTANTAALNAALQGIGQNTQTALQGIGASAQDTLAKYAPQGEGGLNSAAVSSLAQEMARQQGLAAQQSGTAQGFGALQGANYGGLAASQLGTQALAGTAAIRGISQSGTVANAPLQAKIAGLQAQRGSLLGTALGNLYQQGQANQLTKLGLQAGVAKTGITQAGETARTKITTAGANTRNAATIAAANMRANKTYQLNLKKYGANVAKDTYQKAHGLGPYKPAAGSKGASVGGTKPLSASVNLSRLTDLGRAVSIYGEGRQAKLSPATILQALTSGTSPTGKRQAPINPAIAQAAMELWTYHYLNPRTAAALHSLGIRGGTFQGRPIQVGGPVGGVGSVGSAVGSGVGGVAGALGKALTGK